MPSMYVEPVARDAIRRIYYIDGRVVTEEDYVNHRMVAEEERQNRNRGIVNYFVQGQITDMVAVAHNRGADVPYTSTVQTQNVPEFISGRMTHAAPTLLQVPRLQTPATLTPEQAQSLRTEFTVNHPGIANFQERLLREVPHTWIDLAESTITPKPLRGTIYNGVRQLDGVPKAVTARIPEPHPYELPTLHSGNCRIGALSLPKDPYYKVLFDDIRGAMLRTLRVEGKKHQERVEEIYRDFFTTPPHARATAAPVYPDKPTTITEREWWVNMQNMHELHPAVLDMLIAGHKPRNPHLLVLEWPHRSEIDRKMVAYTQSIDKGLRDIQTRIAPARYVKRHFPDVPDHIIRDIVEVATSEGSFHITTDMEKIVEVASLQSIYSCMNKFDSDDHPYRCYTERWGWALAYRQVGEEIVARALVRPGDKCFVRTYFGNGSNSSNDLPLEGWLTSQGYNHDAGWPAGSRLALVENSNGDYMAPYLDGYNDSVVREDGTLRIVSSGGICLDDTDGLLSSRASGWTCPNCGGCHDDDDEMRSHGRHDDGTHCTSCEDSFVYGHGCEGEEYTFPKDDAVLVDGDWYHDRYLGDNDIIQVTWGSKEDEYAKIDDCVYDSSGDWWHQDDITDDLEDEGVMQIGNQYIPTSELFCCSVDEEVYEKCDGVMVGDSMVHRHNVDEYKAEAETEDETEEEAANEST